MVFPSSLLCVVWRNETFMNHPDPAALPANKTIEDVILELEKIVQETTSQQNYLCTFAIVYLQTTVAIKRAIEHGRFENPRKLQQLDVVFAGLYIRSYYAWKNGTEFPASWKYAFSKCEDKFALLQHILLGMNAHINLDLAVSAALTAPGRDIIGLKKDFMTVNDILSELTNTMQKQLSKISPVMGLLDILGFRQDEKVINFSIRKARDFAWINAMELALLHEPEATNRIKEIDVRVLEISKLIAEPPGRFLRIVLRIISLFETKDASKIEKALNTPF